jgi:hypothetical protein
VGTRAIRTSIDQGTCDVCGRTLLRGERAEIYLSGGARHSVCELCTSRALHDGWVREGEVPEYEGTGQRSVRRRSLLGRLRGRRPDADEVADDGYEEPVWDDEEDLPPPAARAEAPRVEAPRDEAQPPRGASPTRGRRGRRSRAADEDDRTEPVSRGAGRFGGLVGREPRHVRAVPTSIEHKISSAIRLFNDSEHPRTVAGIARSLGLPEVSVHPSDAAGSVVNIVVYWELCWYRYEVDLGDEVPAVRLAVQGYELNELSEIERTDNATCDDRGRLELAG